MDKSFVVLDENNVLLLGENIEYTRGVRSISLDILNFKVRKDYEFCTLKEDFYLEEVYNSKNLRERYELSNSERIEVSGDCRISQRSIVEKLFVAYEISDGKVVRQANLENFRFRFLVRDGLTIPRAVFHIRDECMPGGEFLECVISSPMMDKLLECIDDGGNSNIFLSIDVEAFWHPFRDAGILMPGAPMIPEYVRRVEEFPPASQPLLGYGAEYDIEEESHEEKIENATVHIYRKLDEISSSTSLLVTRRDLLLFIVVVFILVFFARFW